MITNSIKEILKKSNKNFFTIPGLKNLANEGTINIAEMNLINKERGYAFECSEGKAIQVIEE